jgi:hypothetical protein
MMDWTYGSAPLWRPDIGGDNFFRGSPYQVDQGEKNRDDLYTARDEARTRSQFESDREYELSARKLKQDRERIAISRGQAKADEWYNRQSVKLAKRKLEEDARQFNERLAFERQQFQDTSLQGWTDKALQLSRTPKDYFTLMRMQQGVGDNIGSIPGLAWASGGQQGNTTFAGQPEANSLGNVLGNMGVGTGQSGDWASAGARQAHEMINARRLNLTPQQQELYGTAKDFIMNPQMAAGGWLEGLDPLTRDLIQSAAEDQGLDWNSGMSRYKRSRWGGGGSAQAA